MLPKSANKRAFASHIEPPMAVRPEILALCRETIEPAWKRRLRAFLHPFKVRSLRLYGAGEGFHWGKGSMVRGAWIGNFASFGHSAEFHGPVVIGDLTMLSTAVQVIGQDHIFDNPDQPMRVNFPVAPRKLTVIEADCWIGSRVTIMEGVRIGRGSIVGAGSIVTKSIPSYSLAVGAPAKVLRQRFDKEGQQRHDFLLYGRTFERE